MTTRRRRTCAADPDPGGGPVRRCRPRAAPRHPTPRGSRRRRSDASWPARGAAGRVPPHQGTDLDPVDLQVSDVTVNFDVVQLYSAHRDAGHLHDAESGVHELASPELGAAQLGELEPGVGQVDALEPGTREIFAIE